MTPIKIDDALREREFARTLDNGKTIYLNVASTGPLPDRTVRATCDAAIERATPWRFSVDQQFGTLRTTRERCAALIGAAPTEIALMTNTSHGINLAARSLPLTPGDTVLTWDGEFPANVYPWYALERDRGVHYHRVPLRSGVPHDDDLLNALDTVPRVKVVAISWVSFSSGARADLARIGKACKERGITFFVDAMQGLGPLTLDAKACHIDILASGGTKWLLGPWGAGFVYVRQALVESLTPQGAVGWLAMQSSDDLSSLTNYNLTYHTDARRFEVATLPYQDFIGLNTSLSLLFDIGLDAIEKHTQGLTSQIVDWAKRHSNVRLVTPADPARRGAIVAVTPPDLMPASDRLTQAGVIHSVREGAIRLSPYIYNTTADIDRTLEALEG